MTKAKQLGIKEFPYYEYDSNGNLVYREYLSGYWAKSEYNSDGNKIYYENLFGDWEKYDYDSNGNMIYYESSHVTGFFRYYENNKFIKKIEEGYKEHYISYKRNLNLNTLLND